MSPLTLPPRRQTGGLNVLIEQSKVFECESPSRPYMQAADNATKTIYFIHPDCKQWSCRYCAEKRRRMWVYLANYGADNLLRQGLELSFVTLTSHRLVRSITGGVAVWRKAWPKLSSRWRYHSPGVQYLYVGEGKKSRHFHIHLVTSATLKSKWYKDNGAETGLGYQAKAIPIDRAIECGAYIGKYLGKALVVDGFPKYWRRVNTSRKWPKPAKMETPYEWENLGSKRSNARYSMALHAEMGWVIEHQLEGFSHYQDLAT